MLFDIHSKYAVQYKFEVIRKGKIIKSLPFVPHMITDAYLDNLASFNPLILLNTPIIGEGVTPTAVRRDSGAVTFTQVGTTITSSSSFFIASDTGRLFKWGTGEAGNQVYITYVNATTATASISATVAVPEIATIWYVNTASLQTPIIGLTWSKTTNALENYTQSATVGDTCTVTHQTVFYSSALASNKTVSEIAFNNSATNSNVGDRDLISPTVALLTGDQAKITLQTIARYYSVTPVVVANTATGYDNSGDAQIESLALSTQRTIRCYDSSGNISSASSNLEPVTASDISVLTASFSLSSFNANTAPAVGSSVSGSMTNLTYGSGTYYRDSEYLFSISQANGNIYGVCIGSTGQGGRFFTQKFTTPFSKTSSQTLKFTFRKSWSRILTN